MYCSWFTGKSPVLKIGFSTRTTMSGGSVAAMVAAQLSAARTTSLVKGFNSNFVVWDAK